jgi:hypothetical protein
LCTLRSRRYKTSGEKLTDGLSGSDIALTCFVSSLLPKELVGEVLAANERQLTMALLPSTAVAEPPTGKTLVRDVWAEMSPEAASSVASAVGKALRLLHEKGVMHGDV